STGAATRVRAGGVIVRFLVGECPSVAEVGRRRAKNREREQQVDRSQRPQAPEAHLVIDVSEGTERKGGADTRGERRDCPLEDVTGEVGRRTQVAAIGRCGYRPADLDRVG